MNQNFEEVISRLENKLDSLTQVLSELNSHKKYERFLDNDELVKTLKISKRSLSNWRRLKLLPYSMIGNKIFYAFSDVEKLMKDNLITKNSHLKNSQK